MRAALKDIRAIRTGKRSFAPTSIPYPMRYGRMPDPQEALRQTQSQFAVFLAFGAIALLFFVVNVLRGDSQSPFTIILGIVGVAGVAGSLYRLSPLGRRRFLRGYERVFSRMKQMSHDEIVRGTIRGTIRTLVVLSAAIAGEIAIAIASWSSVSWRPYTVSVAIATCVLTVGIGLGTLRWVRLGGPGAGNL